MRVGLFLHETFSHAPGSDVDPEILAPWRFLESGFGNQPLTYSYLPG
jgi:hypothetical protein